MSHTVQVDPSGVEITVNDGQTILDAALGQDVALPHGCKGGACGACKCKVTSGEVYYDDDPMALSDEDAASGYTLSCVAKVKRAVRRFGLRVVRQSLMQHCVKVWLFPMAVVVVPAGPVRVH